MTRAGAEQPVSPQSAVTPPCGCRNAVLNAWAGMLSGGADRDVAIEVAVRVYCWHHPARGEDEARRIVESWLAAETIH